jgi:hypothetical protein
VLPAILLAVTVLPLLMVGGLAIVIFVQHGPVWLRAVGMFPAILLGLLLMAAPFYLVWRLGYWMYQQQRNMEGGKLCLRMARLEASNARKRPAEEAYPLENDSRFELEDRSDHETTRVKLLLRGEHGTHTVAETPQLTTEDLQWLKARFNEWLGCEFPAYCIACGHLLLAQDLNWALCRVECSACGFTCRSCRSLEKQAVPPAPPMVCPSCAEPILLPDIIPSSGWCCCQVCHWESEVASPLRDWQNSRNSFKNPAAWVSRIIPEVFKYPQHLVSEAKLIDEFPDLDSARIRLGQEQVVEIDAPERFQVAFTHWRTPGLRMLLMSSGLLLTWTCFWLVKSVQAEPGILLEGGAEWGGVIGWVLGLCAWTGCIWWAQQRTRLIFTSDALGVQCGKRLRVVGWNTLGGCGVLKNGWPPTVLMQHGGRGFLLMPPTRSAARAIVRICLEYRGRWIADAPTVRRKTDELDRPL